MEPHLGDTYFDTRARLGAALVALSKLGAELELETKGDDLLGKLLTSINEPFLFTVVGEVNAGKSTLLNALFGQEFCPTGGVPTTAQICLFKYGEEERDVSVKETMVEMYRHKAFLRDFQIVDTPGTNSIMEDHQDITERFVPMADLVIFTFSVTNPWGATAWTLLKNIHKRWYKNVIFVLQQCDLREAHEIEAIVEHLEITAMQRLGQRFPIFAISAKQALMARTSGLDKERLWRESRFAGFEKHISDMVNALEIREKKLGSVSRSARVVLREAQDKLATAARMVRADEELLQSLSMEVKKQERRSIEKAGGLVESLDSSYMERSIAGSARLQDRLGFFPARGVAAIPQEIGTGILEGLEKSAREQTVRVGQIVEDDLEHLWDQLAESMQSHFDFKIRVGSESGKPDWSAQQKHLSEALVQRIRTEVKALGLEDLLTRSLRVRNGILGALLGLFVAVLAGGVAAHVLEAAPESLHSMVLAGTAGLAVILLILTGGYGQHSADRIDAKLAEHLQAGRERIGAAIQQDLEEEIEGFYEDFLGLFGPLHALCEEHRSLYQPQIDELGNLTRAFNEVDLMIGIEPPPREPASA